MDTEVKLKIDSLQLSWFTKTTKLLAYDFQLKNYENLISFVNEVFEMAKIENYFPDVIIHKQKNVRIELYDKNTSGVSLKEADIAQKIEEIYISKFESIN